MQSGHFRYRRERLQYLLRGESVLGVWVSSDPVWMWSMQLSPSPSPSGNKQWRAGMTVFVSGVWRSSRPLVGGEAG